MTTIYLEGRDIPASLRGDYKGNKFSVVVCETVTIPMDAGLWSGGSRNSYCGVDMVTGERSSVPFAHTSPWNGERKDIEVKLEPGKAVVESIMFQGKDLGLRIYLHPDNATKLLPVKSELTELEKIVLKATKSLKSSYGGKDRYEMTLGYDQSMGREVPTRAQWEAAKQTLIASGHLDKRGAITVKGKNAC
jgi:hypothetical protein